MVTKGKVKVWTACVGFGTAYGAACGTLCGSLLVPGSGGLYGAVAGGALGAIGGCASGILGNIRGGPRGWCAAGALGAAVLPAAALWWEGADLSSGLLLGGLALLGGSLGFAVGSGPERGHCSLPGVQALARVIEDATPAVLTEAAPLNEVTPSAAPEGRGDEAAPIRPVPA